MQLSGKIAVVGVAKNCGKTTTLNYLLDKLGQGQRPGLVSVGIDGEDKDYLISTKKPLISVGKGSLVVSSARGFEESSARIEYVEPLGYSTPMGAVYLAEVKEPGEVLLSGMRHAGDVSRALELMATHGADPCFVDGAYGRVVGARSGLTDGVVVSTGAVLATSLKEVVKRTVSLTDRLTCKAVNVEWRRALMRQALDEQQALLGGEDEGPQPLRMKSALVGLPRSRDLWKDAHTAIAIPGVVSNRVLEELLAVTGPARRCLVIEDGTHLHADDRLLTRFRKSWDVEALESLTLMGVSYNPTSLQGHAFEDVVFYDALRAQYDDDLWIFNPQSERV